MQYHLIGGMLPNTLYPQTNTPASTSQKPENKKHPTSNSPWQRHSHHNKNPRSRDNTDIRSHTRSIPPTTLTPNTNPQNGYYNSTQPIPHFQSTQKENALSSSTQKEMENTRNTHIEEGKNTPPPGCSSFQPLNSNTQSSPFQKQYHSHTPHSIHSLLQNSQLPFHSKSKTQHIPSQHHSHHNLTANYTHSKSSDPKKRNGFILNQNKPKYVATEPYDPDSSFESSCAERFNNLQNVFQNKLNHGLTQEEKFRDNNRINRMRRTHMQKRSVSCHEFDQHFSNIITKPQQKGSQQNPIQITFPQEEKSRNMDFYNQKSHSSLQSKGGHHSFHHGYPYSRSFSNAEILKNNKVHENESDLIQNLRNSTRNKGRNKNDLEEKNSKIFESYLLRRNKKVATNLIEQSYPHSQTASTEVEKAAKNNSTLNESAELFNLNGKSISTIYSHSIEKSPQRSLTHGDSLFQTKIDGGSCSRVSEYIPLFNTDIHIQPSSSTNSHSNNPLMSLTLQNQSHSRSSYNLNKNNYKTYNPDYYQNRNHKHKLKQKHKQDQRQKTKIKSKDKDKDQNKEKEKDKDHTRKQKANAEVISKCTFTEPQHKHTELTNDRNNILNEKKGDKGNKTTKGNEENNNIHNINIDLINSKQREKEDSDKKTPFHSQNKESMDNEFIQVLQTPIQNITHNTQQNQTNNYLSPRDGDPHQQNDFDTTVKILNDSSLREDMNKRIRLNECQSFMLLKCNQEFSQIDETLSRKEHSDYGTGSALGTAKLETGRFQNAISMARAEISSGQEDQLQLKKEIDLIRSQINAANGEDKFNNEILATFQFTETDYEKGTKELKGNFDDEELMREFKSFEEAEEKEKAQVDLSTNRSTQSENLLDFLNRKYDEKKKSAEHSMIEEGQEIEPEFDECENMDVVMNVNFNLLNPVRKPFELEVVQESNRESYLSTLKREGGKTSPQTAIKQCLEMQKDQFDSRNPPHINLFQSFQKEYHSQGYSQTPANKNANNSYSGQKINIPFEYKEISP